MLNALKNSLPQTERVDILTAFFYFSGYDQLADELKDKKIRILVGKMIDPDAIEELCSDIKDDDNVDLSAYVPRGKKKYNNTAKRNAYIDGFVRLFNKSSLSKEFDNSRSQQVFKMFLDKIQDGSLEIRMTKDDNHAKAYILTNKPEHSCSGDQKGIVFTGSSNFTYNGLLGQGEMNERFSDNTKYDEYEEMFEELWNDSTTINIVIKDNHDDFIKAVKDRLWLFAKPSPYKIFIRILFELYSAMEGEDIETPYDITHGKFTNMKYQIDAIKYGMECVKKNNGVIIADVVGLGKSVIASAIARNLDMDKTVIIAPPHLVDQWQDYVEEFGLRGAKVSSIGKIEELYKRYAEDEEPILYIVDEAHRYRNELTENYQWLHQLTRSNVDNKVILLTATPYNNKPQDLFALIKLFQTPSRSTINSVDNLGVRFHELIAQYNKLSKEGKKKLTPEIKFQLENLSEELRNMIAPIIVRRSRIDLKEITEYADDLRQQNIAFPEVVGPELVEYDLGSIRGIYTSTLQQITDNFIGARYNATNYLRDPKAFMKEYKDFFDMNLQVSQGNLVQFMKRLFIMRFESSKEAFKASLESMLHSYENMKKWWEKGYVPILKKGYLDDPNEEEIEETLSLLDDFTNQEIDIDKIKSRALPIPKEKFHDAFIHDLENDIELMQNIWDDWFSDENSSDCDPKYNELKKTIDKAIHERSDRKIVIFSFFAVTAEYVKSRLESDGYRVLLYTGSSSNSMRGIVKSEFDASCKESEQTNDFDIIVATDALSEGFNLNRAGIIFNYDIPYNPTRVIQRIGRINRINRKMFDEIYIYNFFPTEIGENAILTKGISTLKMLLINNIVGSDTRTLTPDETLQSYFKRQYEDADTESTERSWDNEYRNIYDAIKHNRTFQEDLFKIPERAKIVRRSKDVDCTITYVRRGENSVFARLDNENLPAEIVPIDQVLHLFKADESEEALPHDDLLDIRFAKLRDKVMAPYPKIRLDKRKGAAIDNLSELVVICPAEKDYLQDLLEVIREYDDLSDGELKYLSKLNVKANTNNAKILIDEIKTKIPAHYISQIKERAESIDAQNEVIMFTEDLRSGVDE